LKFIILFSHFLVYSRTEKNTSLMKSWASIVKHSMRENGSIATQVSIKTTKPASETAADKKEQKQNGTQNGTQDEREEQVREIFNVHERYLKEVEERDKEMGNIMPLFRYIVRPDTHPLFAPIFKDVSEKCRWEHEQWRLNQEYSSMLHDRKVAVWEKKNNWFPVPFMTEMTDAQKKMGFFPIGQPSLYKFGYLCPHNSEETRHEFLHFLLRLLLNRSEQVCACKTVGDFEKVYLEAMNLTRCSDAEWTPAELKRERKTALNALWVLSTKANLFPGKQVMPRNPAPSNFEKVKTVFGDDPILPQDLSDVRHILKTGQKRYDVIGVERGETGVCGVKDAKTLGNLAPIRWYMTPAEMRNLKTFDFIFQSDPRRSYLYDDDWSDDDAFY
jgi:hypothetical protein